MEASSAHIVSPDRVQTVLEELSNGASQQTEKAGSSESSHKQLLAEELLTHP